MIMYSAYFIVISTLCAKYKTHKASLDKII